MLMRNYLKKQLQTSKTEQLNEFGEILELSETIVSIQIFWTNAAS